MYVSKYYSSGEEIDERLLQGYYDDFVEAGFEGTLRDFLNFVLSISNKVDKEPGKGLSENDFTDELKQKLEECTTHIVTKVSQLENDLKFQTQEDVEKAIDDLIDGSGEALDTLKELADALNNDPNFATTILNKITDLTNALNTEIGRATAAENSIRNDLDSFNTQLLAKIAEVSNKADSIRSEIQATIGTIQEDIHGLESDIADNKLLIEKRYSESKSYADSLVEVEESRATAAENALSGKIDELTRTHIQDKSELTLSIQEAKSYTDTKANEVSQLVTQEVQNRKDADTTLNERITDEISGVNTTITKVDERVTQEVNDRTQADALLQKDIEAEAKARENADTSIRHNISDLSSSVDSRLQQHEEDVQSKIDTINDSLGNKVDKELGKGLSENDFTDELLEKLNNIEDGAKLITKLSQLENDMDYQTEEQVNAAIEKIIGSAPEVLDTLEEIAKALGDDPNFATTITKRLAAITEQLNAEIESREELDLKVDNQVEQLQSNIEGEKSARELADKELDSKISTEINSLRESLTTLIGNINTTLSSADKALSDRIDSQRDLINTNTANIQHNLELIQGLQSRVDTIKETLDSLTTDSEDLEKRVSALEDTTSTLRSDIDDEVKAREELQSRFNDKVTGIEGKLNDIDTALAKEIQDRKDADANMELELGSKLDNNTSSIEAIQSDLAKVKTDLYGSITIQFVI